MMNFVFFFWLTITFCPLFSVGQNTVSIKELDSAFCADNLNYYKELFGFNKRIDPNYELSFYTAITYVGDNLELSKITIKEASIGTSLNARPTVWSLLFRRRHKRHYVIRVNNNSKKRIPLLKNCDFDSKVGVFAHELCHLVDYSNRSFGGVMNRLFAYASEEKKSIYEKEIDSMTIWKGLGWQLHAWEVYVQESPVATDEYKAFKREIYYEPDEIVGKIEEYDASFD